MQGQEVERTKDDGDDATSSRCVCVRVDSCLPLVYKMKFHLPLMKLFVFMSGRQPEEEKRNVHHLRPLLAA